MAPNLHVKSADGYPVASGWLSTKVPFFDMGSYKHKTSKGSTQNEIIEKAAIIRANIDGASFTGEYTFATLFHVITIILLELDWLQEIFKIRNQSIQRVYMYVHASTKDFVLFQHLAFTVWLSCKLKLIHLGERRNIAREGH